MRFFASSSCRVVLLGAITLSWTAAVQAQPPPNSLIAEQLFREGERLFASGSTHEACEKFAASQKLDPAPGTLNNLAICHEKEGRTASAWFELTELAGLAARAGKKDRERAAREHAATLEKVLARVSVHVPDGAEVVSLDLDGARVDVAALAAAFPIDPGAHAFHLVDAKGRKASALVTVPSGPGTTEVTVAFVSDVPPVVVPRPVVPEPRAERGPPPPSTTKRTVGWTLVATGAAGVAAGGVLGLVANAHRNDHPNDDAFSLATGSDVAVGVGLALAAAGVFFVVTTSSKPVRTGQWRIVPVLARDGGDLRFGGVF